MNPYHIILADDHVLVRQGLRRIIEESPELLVLGEVSDGEELLRLLGCITPSMVILDISMPNLPGLDAVREIKARQPKIRVLMLTMHRSRQYLYQAVKSGADGYLLKEDADTELYLAILKIRQGRFYVSPSLSQELAEYWEMKSRRDGGPYLEGDRLTDREREVLRLIVKGKSSRECAGILCISPRTVDHHRANIMEKLQARTKFDLVQYAIRNGYTNLEHRNGT